MSNLHVLGRWSHGPHMDKHFNTELQTFGHPLHNTGYHPHAAGDGPVQRPHSSRKMKKEDILQEHRQILSHLDDIMDRARAAMTKSSLNDHSTPPGMSPSQHYLQQYQGSVGVAPSSGNTHEQQYMEKLMAGQNHHSQFGAVTHQNYQSMSVGPLINQQSHISQPMDKVIYRGAQNSQQNAINVGMHVIQGPQFQNPPIPGHLQEASATQSQGLQTVQTSQQHSLPSSIPESEGQQKIANYIAKPNVSDSTSQTVCASAQTQTLELQNPQISKVQTASIQMDSASQADSFEEPDISADMTPEKLRQAQQRLQLQKQRLKVQQEKMQALTASLSKSAGNLGQTAAEMAQKLPQNHAHPSQNLAKKSITPTKQSLDDSELMNHKISGDESMHDTSTTSTAGSEKSPDDRKPKLSNSPVTKAVQKSFETVLVKDSETVAQKSQLGHGKSSVNQNRAGASHNEHEKSLPSAEDFLRSLAEMKLAKQSTNISGDSKSSDTNETGLNAEQLAQLGAHFKLLGIDTRPFQVLLGSPSNTRGLNGQAQIPSQGGAKPTASKQLTYAESSSSSQETVIRAPIGQVDNIQKEELLHRRPSAEGEETKNGSVPVVGKNAGKTSIDKHPTAVVAPTHTLSAQKSRSEPCVITAHRKEADGGNTQSQTGARQNVALRSLAQMQSNNQVLENKAIQQNQVEKDQLQKPVSKESTMFTPIHPHPVTPSERAGVAQPSVVSKVVVSGDGSSPLKTMSTSQTSDKQKTPIHRQRLDSESARDLQRQISGEPLPTAAAAGEQQVAAAELCINLNDLERGDEDTDTRYYCFSISFHIDRTSGRGLSPCSVIWFSYKYYKLKICMLCVIYIHFKIL